MYFDSGIDDFGGWLTTLKDYKIVTTAGAWSQMKRQDGSVWKFQGKDFVPKLQEDPELNLIAAKCDRRQKKLNQAVQVN